MARRLEFQIPESYEGKKVKEFLKNEAKVSYRMLCVLKRDKAGITVNGAHIRTVDFLHAGDRLALLSDGVCDFSVEAQTRALAASARTLASVPPGDAAEMLLGRMRRRFGSTDDAAVVLIDVARRDTAWHGALFGRKFSAAH